VRRWLHLHLGLHRTTSLICRALPTTVARLLSSFVAGREALCRSSCAR